MEEEGACCLVSPRNQGHSQVSYQTTNASNEPILIFDTISTLNIEAICVSAANAASNADTEMRVLLNVFHSHCVYANPIDPIKLICATQAKVDPNL